MKEWSKQTCWNLISKWELKTGLRCTVGDNNNHIVYLQLWSIHPSIKPGSSLYHSAGRTSWHNYFDQNTTIAKQNFPWSSNWIEFNAEHWLDDYIKWPSKLEVNFNRRTVKKASNPCLKIKVLLVVKQMVEPTFGWRSKSVSDTGKSSQTWLPVEWGPQIHSFPSVWFLYEGTSFWIQPWKECTCRSYP